MTEVPTQPPITMTAATTYSAPYQVPSVDGITVLTTPDTSAICYLAAPLTPTDGQAFTVKEAKSIGSVYPVVIFAASEGQNTVVLAANGSSVTLIYSANRSSWLRISAYQRNFRLRNTDGPFADAFYRGYVACWPGRYPGQAASPFSTVSGTSQYQFMVPTAGHNFSGVWTNIYNPTLSEVLTNPVTIRASIKTASTGVGTPIYFGGRRDVTIQSGGRVRSDPYPMSAAARAMLFIDTFAVLCQPPLAFAVTASTASGTLAAGTYILAMTSVHPEQGESGPTASQTVTLSGVGSITGNFTLPDITRAVEPTKFNVYCTAAGGATGTKKYALTVYGAGSTSFVISAPFTLGTASPPVNQTLPVGYKMMHGTNPVWNDSNNYPGSGLTGPLLGTDCTTVATTTGFLSAAQYGYGPASLDYVPDGNSLQPNAEFNQEVFGFWGDSISWGFQDSTSFLLAGYLATALYNLGLGFRACYSRPAATMLGVSSEQSGRLAYDQAAGVTRMLVEMGVNDILSGGQTLAQLQTSSTNTWAALAKRTQVYQMTLTPATYTTDGGATVAGQVLSGSEVTGVTAASPAQVTIGISNALMTDGDPVTLIMAAGQPVASGNYYLKKTGAAIDSFFIYTDAGLTSPVTGTGSFTGGAANAASIYYRYHIWLSYNTWIRDGAPIAANYSPFPAGTTNPSAIRAGQPGHPLSFILDACGMIEVDASGAQVLGGSYWPAGASGDGLHPNAGVPACAAALQAKIVAAGINVAT